MQVAREPGKWEEITVRQRAELERLRTNIQDETDSASLYRVLATIEARPALAEVYRRLAETEEEHLRFWQSQLPDGARGGVLRPSWRAKVLAWLARRFGPELILPALVGREGQGSTDYTQQPETRDTALPGQEQSHARLLQAISGPARAQLGGSVLAQIEGRHRASSGNALRASVLGASDGLLSNLSLVMGVAGADLAGRSILITGLAGLLAGAFSMALGEWISVQSSRELYERQLAIERAELIERPDEEAEELALIYQAKGISEEQARALAGRIVADQGAALETLAREELNIDPTALGGSAWEAAVTSFLLFAVGAIIPVVPFVFLTGWAAVVVSLILSVLGLFAIGAAITLLTGRSIWYSGLRQVLFGLIAAAITFAIGRALGVSIGG